MFQADLTRYSSAVQTRIMEQLGGPDDVPLHAAMRYAVEGGKALRGYFVCASAALFEIELDVALYPATAIEAIHAYSLIHDDLPAMDNDDLRRGKPTVHKAWDDATAILAGDALQSLAFEWLTCAEFRTKDAVKLELSHSLAQASCAMVLGQTRDIAMETRPANDVSLEEIEIMQRGKTGALIEWSCTAGAKLAEAPQEALSQYALAIGLAFQIADDVLDVEGNEAMTGKSVGKDAAANKATFISLLGLDGAKKRAQELVQCAQDSLAPYGSKAGSLREAARFIIDRQK